MIDEIRDVLKTIVDDATGDIPGPKRLWPIRAENYRRAKALLEEKPCQLIYENKLGFVPMPINRNRLAADIMEAMVQGGINCGQSENNAIMAVAAADALIAELAKEPKA
jgi:hypothetical protein